MWLSSLDWEFVRERSRHFTGRAWVFDALRTFLRSPPGRFVIVGLPGTGKTAIAAQVLQASAGTAAPEQEAAGEADAGGPLPRGTVHAAYLCRSGQVDILDCAQRLSDQLCQSAAGFEETLRTVLTPQVAISGVRVETGAVAAGAAVAGVRINLGGLSPEQAFTQGVSVPLKRLREKGHAGQVVIMIDGLDEALSSDATRELTRLVADVEYAHLIITTRPDRRVLGLLEDRAEVHQLVDQGDVAEYAANQLRSLRNAKAGEILAARIAEAAGGNFLYAFYVINSLLAEGSKQEIDEEDAKRLELPQGGLPGVYREFLQRRPAAWAGSFYPVLAPVTVAQGTGLNSEQLTSIASRIGGEAVTRTKVRQVVKDAYQFLEGKLPDGPFRLYHKSFADFLQDAEENPDFIVDGSEAHAAVVKSYLDKPRAEWDTYAWRYLLTHAYQAGAESASFDLLFKLADDTYHHEKQSQLGRTEWVSADFELLFEACEARRDLGRLARYAAARSSLANYVSVLECPGLLRLMLSHPDREQVARTLAQLRSSAELVLDPVHKAAVLINLYGQCPEWLADGAEARDIPDAAWKPLQTLAGSSSKNYQITRLMKAVTSLGRDRLNWAESLLDGLNASDYLSEAWAILAEGHLRWGDEENAVRCLKETLRHLPSTSIFSVARFFEACADLKRPEALLQLYEATSEVRRERYLSEQKQAEFYSIASGLLARAGKEAEAVRQIELASQLFEPSTEDERQHSFSSVVADALGQFRQPQCIERLWHKFQTALESLSVQSARRLAARLVIAKAAHVRHGVVDPESALQDVAALGSFELGLYGCREQLEALIDACAKAKSLAALSALAHVLGNVEPARDHARLAARLLTAFDALGETETASGLFAEAQRVLHGADVKERIGGGLALAGTPRARANGLDAALVENEFGDLRSLNDDFDRTTRLEEILATLKSFPDSPFAASVIGRAVRECRLLTTNRALSTVAERASELLPAAEWQRLALDINTSLNTPQLSVATINATAATALALHETGQTEEAGRALRQTLDIFEQLIDERYKWFAAGDIARACAQLGDEGALRRMLEIGRRFSELHFSGMMYGEVADALLPGQYTNLLEHEAEGLLDLFEQIPQPRNEVTLLGNIARGLRRTPATGDNFRLLERVVEGLVRVPPLLEMKYSSNAEFMLNGWGNVITTQNIWRLEEESSKSLETAMDWWCSLVKLTRASGGWSTRVEPFVEALLSVPDEAARQRLIRSAFEHARHQPAVLFKLVETLCAATAKDEHSHLAGEMVAVCREEMAQATLDGPELDAQFSGFNDELAYGCVLANAELAAALDWAGRSAEAADLFRRTLERARQIKDQQMQTWGYSALLQSCPRANPARIQIEKESLDLIPKLGDMGYRSNVAQAWLKTAKVEQRATAFELFGQVKPRYFIPSELNEMMLAFLRNGEQLPLTACWLLRSAARFSTHVVWYASALVARESFAREGRVNEQLTAFLRETLLLGVAA